MSEPEKDIEIRTGADSLNTKIHTVVVHNQFQITSLLAVRVATSPIKVMEANRYVVCLYVQCRSNL